MTMLWNIRRALTDLRSPTGTSWYWLTANGTWSANMKDAADYAPLADAEGIAKTVEGQVTPRGARK